ncbi:MAG: UTP--glucose-1-phosphate uridylyltransferase [Desulfobacterales bacterium]|nr:UTP--glucose-1-phosphate uridylyltransferase [Desulfobacterales bacterium]
MKMTSDQKFAHLPSFKAKLKQEGLPSVVIDTFSYYYRKLVTGETGLIYDQDISAVAPEEIESAENLAPYKAAGEKALKKSVQITLNGGLGTSMGLTGAKSLLKVKDDKSFLAIIVQQARSIGVKLALMNSFNTHRDTLAALEKIDPNRLPLTFLQHKFPKILQSDLSPASWPKNPELEWNPPGHGDVYTALYTSGMLQRLLDEGVVYAFISNSDNLGANMDAALLGYFAENRFPFMMEVAEKTAADVKGGHLARLTNGRLILREIAQCPQEERDACMDIARYRFFNTNNIWINLEFLKELIGREKAIYLPMILNPKNLDPRDKTSPDVFQIETAMGAAISLFDDAAAVRVPRARFFPVKMCSDLLAVRSDCFVFDSNGSLVVNPERQKKRRPDSLAVDLDPQYYAKIDLFDARFESGIPSLINCETLKIEGDVRFERDVTIAGRVLIKNSRASQVVVEKGSVIEKDLYF